MVQAKMTGMEPLTLDVPPELEELARRIWPKLHKQGDCWVYLGYHNPKTGYAQVSVQAHPNHFPGRTATVPKVMCTLAHGSGDGRLVLHSCDNRRCCNPAHLRWGTHEDNMLDRMQDPSDPSKRVWGESHPGVKYSTEQVAEARRLAAEGVSCAEIARAVNVPYHSVYGWIRKGGRPHG